MKIVFRLSVLMAALTICTAASAKKKKVELFPDGTPIPAWFSDTVKVDINTLGKKYVITDYGVKSDSTIVQTEQIQKVIDTAAENGGGLIVIPKGTFLSGSLFFKKGTHLYVDEG